MTKNIQNLKWRYAVFLGLIIIMILVSQLIIHYDLEKQNSDANLINLAGRQRMLSQRIAKLTLYIHYDINETGTANPARLDTLSRTLEIWISTHKKLIQENENNIRSEAIASLLEMNTPNLKRMALACQTLIDNPIQKVADDAVKIVVDNDVPFLLLMEKTVKTYQNEAETKLAYIKRVEWVLSGVTILIVVLAFIFIFLPSINKMIEYNKALSEANADLVASEEEIRTNLEQISVLQTQFELSEKKYRTLIENSHDLIAVFDMEGNYTFVSDSSKEILGYEPHELVGTFGMGYVHPDDRFQLVDEPLRRLLNGEKVLNPEFRLRKKDGSYIWIEAYSIPVVDDNGKIIALQTANRDITDRKRIEDILRKSEERYRLVSENSQDFIALHKPDGTYTFVSPSVKSLLGYEPSELLGLSGFDLIHPDDFELLVSQSRDKALSGEVVLNTQFRMRKKDQSYIWVEAYTKPITDEHGAVIAVQTSARDITQRKIFENKIIEAKEESEKISAQLSALLSDKNDLIGMFSHDLRSPVNQIKGMVELISLSLDDSETVKYCLSKMDEITTKQLSLFESILAMLKTDQLSTQKELFELIPLNQLIETCSKNLSKEVSEKKLNLIISLAEEMHVFAHPTLFYQAIHNLLSNAIKFTPVGNTIRIVIWDDPTHIKIAIKDEGIGFEPGKAERLFDRFTQESRLGTNNERSTGLGLYLVRKIIQNHNGYVNAESEGIGKGAVFTVAIKKQV